MKKILFILVLSLYSIQGYASSCPDGSEPVKSVSLDGSYYVYSCNVGNEQSDSSTANSRAKVLAGIDIENDPNLEFFKPPLKPYPIDQMYNWGRQWQLVDYNNDGFSDVLYVGVQRPNNLIKDLEGIEMTGHAECGDGDNCKGIKPLPSLFLGDADGNFT